MIISLWGEEGKGKSSVGLTFPKPLFHQELDIGGFDRAAWFIEQEYKKNTGMELRIKRCEAKEDIDEIDWNEWDIVTKPYITPVQLEKLQGLQGISIKLPKQVKGVKEVWQEIIVDTVTVGQVPAVKTIMPDSATQLWNICHTGFLQEKQEMQIAQGLAKRISAEVTINNPDFRERLQPVEFPNNRMREVIYTVKSFGKNYVMTHYPKDIYANRVTDRGIESYATGEVEPDGFKHTVTLDDIVLWCYTEVDKRREIIKGVENPDYNKPVPHAKISLKCGLSGMGMKCVGLELPSPSYDGLLELQAMVRGD